jgi:hypothetical protein
MRTTIERLSPVTVSCGVAEAMPTNDATTWLARTDAALYSAKTAGRNQVFQHTGSAVCSAPPREDRAPIATGSSREDSVRETIRSVSETLRELPRPKLLNADVQSRSMSAMLQGE